MKKYLILPLSILWITNVYSDNSNMIWLARKMLPCFEKTQNSNNNNGKNRKNRNRKMSWFAKKILPCFKETQNSNNNNGKDSMHFFITHTLPNLNASMWLHRRKRSRNANG